MPTIEPLSELLCPGKNGIETSVAIVDVLSGFSRRRKRMLERKTVKEIFRRFNVGGVRYALIGGLAHAQYAPPRSTQDIDFIVLSEDVSKVQQLFSGCYLRGTAIAGIYEFEGTRFDVQPASLRAQIAVITHAVDDTYEGEPIKVASVRDLLLLKLWAAAERSEPTKRMRDRADVMELLAYNVDKITAADIAYVCQNLLSFGYTAEEVAKYQQSIAWLNQVLDELGMPDRKYLQRERLSGENKQVVPLE